jgi:hypothetical protein
MFRFIFILLLLNLSLSAQKFTLGPKFGINFSSLNFDQRFVIKDTTFHYVTKDAKLGFVGGLWFRISPGTFFIQPEILFAQDRTTFNFSNSIDTILGEMKYNKIDIPLNIGVKFAKMVRFNAAIVGSYILDRDIENLKDAYYQVRKLSTSDMNWSWNCGLGFDIKKRLTFDIKYEGNLGNYSNSISVLGNEIPITQRKNTVQLTLGIALIPFKTL